MAHRISSLCSIQMGNILSNTDIISNLAYNLAYPVTYTCLPNCKWQSFYCNSQGSVAICFRCGEKDYEFSWKFLFPLVKIFTRATLCVSAVFAVWLAVCLSHAAAKPILKLFGRSGSTIIPVFSDPVPIPNSKGNPVSGGAIYMGVRKFCNFQLKSSISETVRDRPMVTMEL